MVLIVIPMNIQYLEILWDIWWLDLPIPPIFNVLNPKIRTFFVRYWVPLHSRYSIFPSIRHFSLQKCSFVPRLNPTCIPFFSLVDPHQPSQISPKFPLVPQIFHSFQFSHSFPREQVISMGLHQVSQFSHSFPGESPWKSQPFPANCAHHDFHRRRGQGFGRSTGLSRLGFGDFMAISCEYFMCIICICTNTYIYI